jgi:uncharacterized phage protein (TIGR02218 family)
MKALPPALAAHLDGAATTTCHAWRLTRRDGLVLGFTEHDRDLAFAGTLFAAASGFSASEVESGLGMNADAADLAGAFASDTISAEDLADGRYDGALVETFLINWASPADQHALLSTRELGEVRSASGAFRAELRSLAARLDAPQGRLYARRCDAEFGDGRCGVNLASHAVAGTVISAGMDGTLHAAGLGGHGAGWFRNGRLSFTSGRLAGLAFTIADHEVSSGEAALTLWSPPAALPGIGDGFTVVAGCDKTRETCSARFGNILNFQGFPYMPGGDFAYGYADGDSVHDGRPIMP